MIYVCFSRLQHPGVVTSELGAPAGAHTDPSYRRYRISRDRATEKTLILRLLPNLFLHVDGQPDPKATQLTLCILVPRSSKYEDLDVSDVHGFYRFLVLGARLPRPTCSTTGCVGQSIVIASYVLWGPESAERCVERIVECSLSPRSRVRGARAQRLANACLRIARACVILTTPAPSLTRFTHGSKWFRRMAPTISQNVRRCSCSSKRDGRRSMGKSRLTQCNGSAHAHRGLTHNGQGVPTLRGMA
jgi:hypothetical protein